MKLLEKQEISIAFILRRKIQKLEKAEILDATLLVVVQKSVKEKYNTSKEWEKNG
jgi:hypothetical protein